MERDSKHPIEPTVSDKQARIAEIAQGIFMSRCAQNAELKGYLDLFISNEEKNIIREKEAKERELEEQLYENAKKEYEEYEEFVQMLQDQPDENDDFVFQPLEDDFYEQIKKEYFYGTKGTVKPIGRVGYYPEKTYDEEIRRKALPWREGPNYIRATPRMRKKSVPPVAPLPPIQGPTYDDQVKNRLDELAEQMNKEIEMAYFLAKLFVDRRLKVLK